MNLTRYPTYKFVDVSWIGEVPAHWGIAPLLGVASERAESNSGFIEDNLLSLSYGEIVRKEIGSNDGLLPESFETYQIIHEGDIVLRLTDLQNDKRSLRSARARERGIITSAYLALRPESIDSAYLAYLLRAMDQSKVFYSMGGGLRQSMKYADLKRMPIVLPSSEEQAAIAAFLDRETANIEALIAEQERLLTLLAEKRQAVISHAVTKGLNPDARMKDSGVAWLGEVPAHWEVLRVKHCILSVEQGWSPQCDGIPTETEDEWGVLKVGCVNGGVFNPAENKKLPVDLEPRPSLAIREGDVLVSRANTRELVGSSAVALRDFERLLLCDKLYRIRTNSERLLPAFLSCWLGSGPARSQIQLDASGASSSMLNIGQGAILEMLMPVPSISEQSDILSAIEKNIGQSVMAQGLVERSIALLRERRSSLIAAAVTGQIDVREAA